MKRLGREESDEQFFYYNSTFLEEFFDNYLTNTLTRSLISEDKTAINQINDQLKTQLKQYKASSPSARFPYENIVGSEINQKYALLLLFVELMLMF
jgi:hypothetical protein